MPDSPQNDCIFTELDPDILSTPFRVQTNWHVITGAVSSGKSSLIDKLAEIGFQTIPETGRLYLEREIAKGQSLDEIRANFAALQIAVKDMQLKIEQGLRADDVIFLDGYASIFILDPLPFQKDGARDDDADKVGYLDEWITRDYIALGYRVVRVPVLSLNERLAFVREWLHKA
jgi:predicted ATPase